MLGEHCRYCRTRGEGYRIQKCRSTRSFLTSWLPLSTTVFAWKLVNMLQHPCRVQNMSRTLENWRLLLDHVSGNPKFGSWSFASWRHGSLQANNTIYNIELDENVISSKHSFFATGFPSYENRFPRAVANGCHIDSYVQAGWFGTDALDLLAGDSSPIIVLGMYAK